MGFQVAISLVPQENTTNTFKTNGMDAALV
jgi:hypothetical protein